MFNKVDSSREIAGLRATCAGLQDENQRVKATLKGIAKDNLRSLITSLYMAGSTKDVVIHIAKNLTQFQVRLTDNDSKPPRGWTKYVVECDRIQSADGIEAVLGEIYNIPVKFNRVIKEF
jgi:hypothetical protein